MEVEWNVVYDIFPVYVTFNYNTNMPCNYNQDNVSMSLYISELPSEVVVMFFIKTRLNLIGLH